MDSQIGSLPISDMENREISLFSVHTSCHVWVQVSAHSLAYPLLIALFLKDAFPWLVCWGWCLTLELISVTHEPSRVLDKSLGCPWPVAWQGTGVSLWSTPWYSSSKLWTNSPTGGELSEWEKEYSIITSIIHSFHPSDVQGRFISLVQILGIMSVSSILARVKKCTLPWCLMLAW